MSSGRRGEGEREFWAERGGSTRPGPVLRRSGRYRHEGKAFVAGCWDLIPWVARSQPGARPQVGESWYQRMRPGRGGRQGAGGADDWRQEEEVWCVAEELWTQSAGNERTFLGLKTTMVLGWRTWFQRQ